MRLILRELNPKYLIPCSPHAYHVRCLGAESTVNSNVGPGGEGAAIPWSYGIILCQSHAAFIRNSSRRSF